MIGKVGRPTFDLDEIGPSSTNQAGVSLELCIPRPHAPREGGEHRRAFQTVGYSAPRPSGYRWVQRTHAPELFHSLTSVSRKTVR